MSFTFHPEAAEEFEAAVAWYEERENGLGIDFAAEVNAAIRRAVAMPEAWALLTENIRRVLVSRFPYGVLYAQQDDGLIVLAVMHLRREPGCWMPRTN